MTITFLTSVYNTNPDYVSQLWKSIKEQNASGWQWIIRNDGAETPVARHIGFTDPRVTYIFGDNLGRGASMAELMKHPAIGDWVIHVDADDWLEPNTVEAVEQAISENPDAALIYADHWCHRLDRIDNGLQLPSIAEDLLHGSRMFHLIAMNMSAYRKTSGYNPELRHSSDYDVWLKLQEVGRFHHLPIQLYHWREHLDQMYHNYRDEQLFCGYKAVKAACLRRKLPLKPVLTWHLNSLKA